MQAPSGESTRARSRPSLKASVPQAQEWLRPEDRVLVTGSSGWFGRTLLTLLGPHPHVLAVGSPRDVQAAQWDESRIEQFEPTVVANFAFHTRDRLHGMGAKRFIDENRELTRRFIHVLGMSSVRLGLTVSSGAVVSAGLGEASPEIDAYGALKAEEEHEALSLATESRRVSVVRAYSVSGPFVRRVRDYAFSDLIAQAIEGDIMITADRPVYRRYVAVKDLLTVALCSGDQGWSGIIDSGGELVEMQDLAQVVKSVVNPSARIRRAELRSSTPSTYASDNETWEEACGRTGTRPLPLVEQVRPVEAFLRSSNEQSQ